MQKKQVLTNDNTAELFPHLKQWNQRITKVVLFNLDGTTSEVKLTFPIFSHWGEPSEISQHYLSNLVCDWSRFWIKIRAYQIHLGSIDKDGNEGYSISYAVNEIPLNKIYVDGKWISPKAAEEKEKKRAMKINKSHYQ